MRNRTPGDSWRRRLRTETARRNGRATAAGRTMAQRARGQKAASQLHGSRDAGTIEATDSNCVSCFAFRGSTPGAIREGVPTFTESPQQVPAGQTAEGAESTKRPA